MKDLGYLIKEATDAEWNQFLEYAKNYRDPVAEAVAIIKVICTSYEARREATQ